MMSMEGRFSGLRMDSGSLESSMRKLRSYCFLPSVLIGDHCSVKLKGQVCLATSNSSGFFPSRGKTMNAGRGNTMRDKL